MAEATSIIIVYCLQILRWADCVCLCLCASCELLMPDCEISEMPLFLLFLGDEKTNPIENAAKFWSNRGKQVADLNQWSSETFGPDHMSTKKLISPYRGFDEVLKSLDELKTSYKGLFTYRKCQLSFLISAEMAILSFFRIKITYLYEISVEEH